MTSAVHNSTPTLGTRRWPEPGALLQLLKPVTWFAPMWALACGVVASGADLSLRWTFLLGAIVLAGPLACGTSQIVNDWFDRHVDAVNEPNRPIPSGRVPGRWGLGFAVVWTLLAAAVAWLLGPVVFGAAVLGLVLAWAYSAPPLRLKQSGWAGVMAVGLSYESIPWFTGAAAVGAGWPPASSTAVAVLYGVGAFGIMVLNDFKAVEGDKQHGVRSLPVQLGVRRAAQVACLMMLVPQLVVVGLLLSWGQAVHALIVGILVSVQVGLMLRFLRDPTRHAVWYSASGVTVYVLGMMVSAVALRGLATGAVG